MLISLLIPIKNRLKALKKALPLIVASANASAPCEILILDYDSQDNLNKYLARAQKEFALADGNFFTFVHIANKPFYHETHTRNCAFKASRGDYVIHLSAEALPSEQYVAYIRERIEKAHPLWMIEENHHFNTYHAHLGRFLVCERKEFEAAGGYDERFEYCSPDDKDICMRLTRRGARLEVYSDKLIDEIPTNYWDKIRHLDPRIYKDATARKKQMTRLMYPIYEENCLKNVLVANEGVAWGKF